MWICDKCGNQVYMVEELRKDIGESRKDFKA